MGGRSAALDKSLRHFRQMPRLLGWEMPGQVWALEEAKHLCVCKHIPNAHCSNVCVTEREQPSHL